MRGSNETIAVLMAAVLTVSIIAAFTVFGAGSVAAVHPDDADDMTQESNFTVNFPNPEDHHPGREGEGSIEYFASGADAFAAQDAEDGVFIDYIIVHAQYDGENWIDYSECSTENTESFGIDRGNNNSGTQTDEDLVQRQKETQFRDDGIVIEFFNHGDIGGDPPYLAAEDAIVASQGEGSAGGPCLTVTDQPGWYRIAGFMNGTVADNGKDSEPSDDAKKISIEMNSNFMYVCECENEEEAREELGPPPNEEEEGGDGGDGEATETEGGDDGGEATETEGGDDGGAATDTAGGDDGGAATDTAGGDDGGAATDTEGSDDGAAGDGGGDTGDEPAVGGDDGDTPESDDQPGFGAVAALIALLASALLLYRRD